MRSASRTSLQPNGAFSYAGDAFAQVPLRKVGEGKDESGRPTLTEAIDTRALAQIKPLRTAEALDRAGKLVDLVGLSPDFTARPSVSHTKLTLSDRAGRPTSETALDTAVSFKFELGGLPVSGQGAKLRVTFAGDGSVTQLSDTLRRLERTATCDHLATRPRRPARRCTRRDVRQGDADARLPAARTRRRGKEIYPPTPATRRPTRATRPTGWCRPSRRRAAGERRGDAPAATASPRRSTLTAAPRRTRSAGRPRRRRSTSNGGARSPTSAARARHATGEDVTLEVTDANGLTAPHRSRSR